jgi:hypothetical protein
MNCEVEGLPPELASVELEIEVVEEQPENSVYNLNEILDV